MTEIGTSLATLAENEPVQVSSSTHTVEDEASMSAQRPSVFSAAPHKFKSLSGLRRPSKIPRLAKAQSSVGSVSGDAMMELSQSSTGLTPTATYSSAASVASGTSSRETTPFSSPSRPSRLREPRPVVVGRKRRRDETGVTIASVAERLLQHKRNQPLPHSEDLSVATTQDDTASQVSMSRDDESESIVGSQSFVEDDEPSLDHKITIARALQRELLRDRARLRLKISAMKEDVETYYQVLVQMEQVTTAVQSQNEEETNEGNHKREAAARLAECIQMIISAKKPENEDVAQTVETCESSETMVEAASVEADHLKTVVPAKTDHQAGPVEEEVEEY